MSAGLCVFPLLTRYQRLNRLSDKKSYRAIVTFMKGGAVIVKLNLRASMNFYHSFHISLQIWGKFGTNDLQIVPLGNCEFLVNRCSEWHALFKGEGEILPLHSM
jgi:hypothetical protein